MDPYQVILRPDVTEKSMKLVEAENKLVLIVARDSNKNKIKEAVESLYEVKVDKVTTLISPKGAKKAYIKLTPEFKADEVATRLGIF